MQFSDPGCYTPVHESSSDHELVRPKRTFCAGGPRTGSEVRANVGARHGWRFELRRFHDYAGWLPRNPTTAAHRGTRICRYRRNHRTPRHGVYPVGSLRRESSCLSQHVMAHPRWLDLRTGRRLPGQFLYGLSGLLASRHDLSACLGTARLGCPAEQSSASSADPCRCRRSGHCGRSDWKDSRCRNVWHVFLGRKTGASKGVRPAACDQLQAARLRTNREGSHSWRRASTQFSKC